MCAVDLLTRAFHLFHKRNPHADPYILGDGPERKSIQELTNSLQLDDSVHLLGFVDKPTVIRMMKQSDLLVLCSKIEGNPRVLVEAMMYRIPIVATNVPGIGDIVQHKKTGYLINYPNPEELAHGIEYVLKDREFSETIVNCAYAFATQNFTKESALRKTSQELSLLLA
jgi:glycosyltransferase involved in cell wall biosynthesis